MLGTYPRHVWDDEPPSARRDRTDDQDGDDGSPWDGDDDAGRRDEAPSAGPQTPRGKAIMLIVVTVVLLSTIVLCCVAISQAAQLYGVDPARP